MVCNQKNKIPDVYLNHHILVLYLAIAMPADVQAPDCAMASAVKSNMYT